MKTIKLKVKDDKYFIDERQLMFTDDVDIGTIIIKHDNISPASRLGGKWELLPSGYSLGTWNWIITDEGEGKDAEGDIDNPRYFRRVPAGVPDITGQLVNTLHVNELTKTGAFQDSVQSGTTRNYKLGESYTFRIGSTFDFKASNSNPIYGNSNTVQPNTYRVYAWLKIAN